MNIKGLELNKILARKIYNFIDNISPQTLRGINAFNSFSWGGFSKEEFKNLLSLFVYLDDRNFFEHIQNDHPFIFNYSTDITEMDIATVLEINSDIYFVDIECKNGEDEGELIKKIKKQISRRKEEYLPQLLKNKNFITVGYVNNKYVCGFMANKDSKMQIMDESVFYMLICGMFGYKNQNEYLIQASNLASIVKLCDDIQKGEYNFFEETNKNYDLLISKIGVDDAFIVYGNAGTGKSVLALKLFFNIENSKILLMNSKLYYAFNFNHKYYSSGRATFNTNIFLENIDKNTISIIDECQRLNISTIASIIKKSKITFLFGDNRQACFKGCTLDSGKQLKQKLLTEYNIKASLRTLKKSRRYNDEVNKALEFLTSPSMAEPESRLPKDYEINIYYDEYKFIEKYNCVDGNKKIYAPFCCAEKAILIAEKTFSQATYTDDEFSIWSNDNDYYGTTFHALSFDIDHSFIYLKSTNVIKFGKYQYIYHKNYFGEPNHDDIQIFMNELNVLFTRGRKSLNILAKDIDTYLYLYYLVNKLK